MVGFFKLKWGVYSGCFGATWCVWVFYSYNWAFRIENIVISIKRKNTTRCSISSWPAGIAGHCCFNCPNKKKMFSLYVTHHDRQFPFIQSSDDERTFKKWEYEMEGCVWDKDRIEKSPTLFRQKEEIQLETLSICGWHQYHVSWPE